MTRQAAAFPEVSAASGQPELRNTIARFCAWTSIMPPKPFSKRAAALTLSFNGPVGFGYLLASDFPVSDMNFRSCLPEHCPSATSRNSVNTGRYKVEN